ncbi:hypothetical protein F4810DRAFT_694175 [Camillea tinctor]|nr:hypothetical protein F4810DRAFT_694175 [Camillea tinctor]
MAAPLDLKMEFASDEEEPSTTTYPKQGNQSFLSKLKLKRPQLPMSKYDNRIVFDILKDSLQPGSETSIPIAAQRISDLLEPGPVPEASAELTSLMEMFLEVAWQIPYNHPSLVKLVQILVRLSDTGKTTRIYDEPDGFNQCSYLHKLGSIFRDYFAQPYEKGSSFKSEEVSRWISQHAFMALVFASGKDNLSLFALWVMRDAFEGSNTPESTDADAAAAAQWILYAGQTLFRFVQLPELCDSHELNLTDPGPLYTGEKGFTVKRWRFWIEGFSRVADRTDSHEEVRKLAQDAKVLMEAMEATSPFLPSG